jgi:hypothetical protein
MTGFNNVVGLFVMACLRRVTLSNESVKRLVRLEKQITISPIYDFDHDTVYRNIVDGYGKPIGWASLDDDDRGACPKNEYYAAIVMTEEGWENTIDENDVLYNREKRIFFDEGVRWISTIE